MALLPLALLALAGALVYAWAPDKTPGATGANGSSSPTPASAGTPAAPPSAAGALLPIVKARDFDPQGRPRHENPDEVKYAYDGRPDTRWKTLTYYRDPQLGGLKRGVGLVLDLGRAQPVSSVTVSLSGNGTDVQARVPKLDPADIDKPPLTSDRRWRTVAKQADAGASTTLTLDEPVSTRYVLVYLTSLPREGRGYRGGISEVQISS